MKLRRNSPQVNAGSMADIAFLLLIFFLVTTTISADKGILRKLPKECPPGQICSDKINERNILTILINRHGDIMIEEEVVSLQDVKPLAKHFIDNNGDKTCNYCSGEGLKTLSDNPKKAIISLKTDPTVKYDLFIKVQDELTKAYYELRKDYVKTTLNKTLKNLTKEEHVEVKLVYPFILSEADTKRK